MYWKSHNIAGKHIIVQMFIHQKIELKKLLINPHDDDGPLTNIFPTIDCQNILFEWIRFVWRKQWMIFDIDKWEGERYWPNGENSHHWKRPPAKKEEKKCSHLKKIFLFYFVWKYFRKSKNKKLKIFFSSVYSSHLLRLFLNSLK